MTRVTGSARGTLMKRLLALATTAIALAAACSAAPTPAPTMRPAVSLIVSNGTTLAVTIFVNGLVLGVVPVGGGPLPTLDSSRLPALPWTVEARSPSGRLLTTMTVQPGDVVPVASDVHLIPMGRVDLSCGRLTMWAGDYAPSGPVPASPAGSPGDCAP